MVEGAIASDDASRQDPGSAIAMKRIFGSGALTLRGASL